MRFNKIALVATLLCLVGGVGAAVAFADDGATPPPPATQCQNSQPAAPEQGTANDVTAAADDVEQEAENQQADDQAGDEQGQNEQQGQNQDDQQGDDDECGDDDGGGGDD